MVKEAWPWCTICKELWVFPPSAQAILNMHIPQREGQDVAIWTPVFVFLRLSGSKKMEYFHIFFVSFWLHGRAVRRGTANPFSPVQIWVSPDQQKNRKKVFN